VLFTNLKQVVIGLVLVFFASFTWADPYLYSSVCPKGSDGNPGGKIYGGWWVTKGNYWADKWNFAQCNCTSYVANRINMNGFIFQNQFRGQQLLRRSSGLNRPLERKEDQRNVLDPFSFDRPSLVTSTSPRATRKMPIANGFCDTLRNPSTKRKLGDRVESIELFLYL